jgi:hypothetical protein
MAAPVPTHIPARFAAGDTLLFDASFPDFSSGSWTLTYAFQKLSPDFDVLTFPAAANGGGFRVTVAASVTALWTEGEYDGQAYLTSGSERHQVWSGRFTVLTNFALGQQTDTRTKARRILDFIDASWEKVVQKQTVRATIEGVDLFFRSLDEMTKARNYWANVVAAEDARSSGKQRGSILARFTRPT